jgi:hypothetical protein
MRRLPAAFCLLIMMILPAAASAGPPGTWTRITARNGSNIDQVGFSRAANGRLVVAWVKRNGGLSNTLQVTRIGPSGGTTPPEVVTANWRSIQGPDVVRAGGGQRIFFGGDQLGRTVQPHLGLESAFSPGSGPFALEAGNRAQGDVSDRNDVGAVAGPGGVPFASWASTFGVDVHRGLVPGANFEYQSSLLGSGCCGYAPDLGLDGASGALWLGWFSNATGHSGLYVARVNPNTGAPASAARRMPGSVTSYAGRLETSQPSNRTPITGRRAGGAGVFTAFAGGYPTTTRAVLWRIGSVRSFVAGRNADGLGDVSVASDPNGRLWVLWHGRRNGRTRVFGRRSNPSVTVFGATVSYGAPRGTIQAWDLFGDAQATKLDLLGHYTTTGGSLAYWSSQIRPGLGFTASRRTLVRSRRTAVTFRVTDAGAPVANARVSVAGRVGFTDAEGHVTLRPGPFGASRRTAAARARKSGYVGAVRTLRVTG